MIAALVAAAWAVPLWWFVVRPRWPWDWKGQRKEIKLRTRRNDWSDD